MKRLLILADDLTGAADTAARCKATGLQATIYLQPPKVPPGDRLPGGAIALTTDSRHLTPNVAAERVQDVLTPLCNLDAIWYKKIDSTLRGNVGSELDAMMHSLGISFAVVCPAFPAQQRGLHNGHLIASEPTPGTLHLPSLLQEQCPRTIAALTLAEVRADQMSLRMTEVQRRGAELLVVDAMEDDDLKKIVDSVRYALPPALMCGSAGLVGALAARLRTEFPTHNRQSSGDDRGYQPEGSVPGDPYIGPTFSSSLVVVGSGTNVAHAQITDLRRQENVSSVCLRKGEEPVSAADRLSTEKEHWILHLPEPGADLTLDGPEARNQASRLARTAATALTRRQPEVLILVGGDTAIEVLTQMDILRLTVVEELLPGIPLCNARTDQPAIVLKPGGFGKPETVTAFLDPVP